MQITRLRVTNYRGIKALDTKIGPKGAIAKGGNAKGKTSILRAVRAALAGRDIGPDAIHIGADKAEILVDLDDSTVRRLITPTASSLHVQSGEHDRKLKPQAYLTELLGTSPLDPLDLFLAKPRERRSLVLAALPAKVTATDVEAWIPDWAIDLIPTHVRGMLEQLHGIDACTALHKTFYDLRGEANAAAKAAANEVETLTKQGAELAAAAPPGDAVTPEGAARRRELAAQAFADLSARRRRVEEQTRRFASSRDTIAEQRRLAASLRDLHPSYPTDESVEAAQRRVHELEKELAAAKEEAHRQYKKATEAKRDLLRAEDLERAAEQLEQSLTSATETAPTADEFAAANAEIEAAKAAADRAEALDRIRLHTAQTERASQSAADLKQRADALTEIVDRLRVEAPSALLARCNGIPGLQIEGEDLKLDGKSLDALSGREQLHLAIEIARRANAKSKILVVDGLERVDPDTLPEFVEAATRDGYQLIATRVDRGELVIETIEPVAADAAAE